MSVANKKKAECCGCSACAEICPKHCINMVEDAKGFLYPKIDTTFCNDCGLCMKSCPLEKEDVTLNTPLKAFAAWNKKRDEYLASSSGGAAHVFSTYILSLGGVVYGCTSDGMNIRHIRITRQAELYRLQGSKYVQSDVRGIYTQVKTDLKAGFPVLFIGTPCQVAGLKKYIKNVPEYLYLVDLICHGVPSQQMLCEHIHHILKDRTAEQLSFRKGQLFRIELTARCGTVYSSEPHKDMYYRAFLKGISYRESCYRCPFARKERVSDITIGDFWGLQDAASLPLEISEGISVLLPSSEKGESLIDSVKSDIQIYERSVEEAVKGNTQLYCPVHNGLSAKLLSILYPYLPFDKAVRIAIVKDLVREFLKNILRPFKPMLIPIINVIRR